jgi:GTPase-associated protein 1
MSDLSGPSFRTGFESYLTGYPLDSGGFYCFARTWFAPELPRPGCVWTHTILISDTDVARVHDFRSLLSHFRRPPAPNDVAGYDTPIRHSALSIEPYDVDHKTCSALLSLLYGSPSCKVVITGEDSRSHENLAIGVFSQQWPRLRRSFRFCTGALAIRDVDFDLAVTPRNALHQSAANESVILTPEAMTTAVAQRAANDWVSSATEDLLAGNSEMPLGRSDLIMTMEEAFIVPFVRSTLLLHERVKVWIR